MVSCYVVFSSKMCVHKVNGISVFVKSTINTINFFIVPFLLNCRYRSIIYNSVCSSSHGNIFPVNIVMRNYVIKLNKRFISLYSSLLLPLVKMNNLSTCDRGLHDIVTLAHFHSDLNLPWNHGHNFYSPCLIMWVCISKSNPELYFARYHELNLQSYLMTLKSWSHFVSLGEQMLTFSQAKTENPKL